MRDSIASYLRNANVDGIRSLEDIVKFNERHAERELPSDWLIHGIHERPTKEEHDLDVAHFRRIARDEGIDELLQRENLNLLAFSMDCLAFTMASAAGE
ncbi:MAG: hypothetical protein Q9207_001841 [Kuettlingeria erythrocarpa]